MSDENRPLILKEANDFYVAKISDSLKNYDLKMSPYGTQCVVQTLSKIYEAVRANGYELNDFERDQIYTVLVNVGLFELNPSACPAECYVMVRKSKSGPALEFGIEGDGNDKIVRRFGVGIKTLDRPWLVRETDKFVYPRHVGRQITPPEWIESHKGGKVVRVVYPVLMEDGTEDYLIAEREDVVRNLQAHISQNALKAEYKAKYDGKEYKGLQKKVMDKIADMTLDDILHDPSLSEYINPAWKSSQSSEQMIIRKMRNNALKSVPKDFNKAALETFYESTFDDYDQYRKPKTEEAKPIEVDLTETETVIDVLDQPKPEPVATSKIDPFTKEPSEPTIEQEDEEEMLERAAQAIRGEDYKTKESKPEPEEVYGDFFSGLDQ